MRAYLWAEIKNYKLFISRVVWPLTSYTSPPQESDKIGTSGICSTVIVVSYRGNMLYTKHKATPLLSKPRTIWAILSLFVRNRDSVINRRCFDYNGWKRAMRNRAEKHAVRWCCHLTHQVIAGASVHSREPKTRVAEVYTYFVSKRFINHSIIFKSCQTYPEHIVICHNAKTVVTATLSTIIFEPKTAAIHERQTRFMLRHHQNTSSNKNQICFASWYFGCSTFQFFFCF